MGESAREPELIGKVFTDEKGKKYQGQRFLMVLDRTMPSGFLNTEIWYKDGKVHGKPAIRYPDGLTEEWKDGNFVAVLDLPYGQSS